MPVGVKPFSVRTLSLSSLECTKRRELTFVFFFGKKKRLEEKNAYK
jgi:hypothetical protein